jgi:phage recombination protein Bet
MLEPLCFTTEQKAAYRSAYAPNASDDQFNLFINECQRRALIPGVHVFFRLQNSKEYDQKLQREVTVQKVLMITGINALRLISERSGNFEGYGRFTYYYGDTDGNPTIKSDIPLGRIPHAVGVEMYRKGWRQPVFATARFEAYVQLKSDGKPNRMWATRGEEQLAKCAEAQGHRLVAPEECGNLYISEEFEHTEPQSEPDTLKELADNAGRTVMEPPKPVVAPAVNQAAANTGTAPKPQPTTAPVVEMALTEEKNGGPGAKCAFDIPVEAKPQPPAPKPAQATPDPAEGGLFANTTPPEPKNETRRLPEIPTLDAAAPASPAQPVVSPKPPTTAVQPAAPVQTGDAPATPAEYAVFINQRATKIIRDKLPKTGMKDIDCANGVKNYLVKCSGKTGLKQISKADFQRLLTVLENATPEDAAAIVKAVK